jgi:hypothetical protein
MLFDFLRQGHAKMELIISMNKLFPGEVGAYMWEGGAFRVGTSVLKLPRETPELACGEVDPLMTPPGAVIKVDHSPYFY